MSPKGAFDIRLRKHLEDDIARPGWPSDMLLRTMREDDAADVHCLLCETLGEPERISRVWWANRQADPEFDANLHFVVTDRRGELAGVAFCWSSAFLKDLAVKAAARRRGIGAALLLHVFHTFRARGALHVDLKTDIVGNPDAVRLYRRHGMVEVDWNG